MHIEQLLAQKSVMAIINCTPDSFYTKSRVLENTIFSVCEKHISEGAKIVDIGGYSSRPGADFVSVEEELDRVLPAIDFVSNNFPDVLISIDTFRKSVAQKAIEAGAHIVNDITGGDGDAAMLDYICTTKTPYVLMHMRGNPKTMQSLCDYEDLVQDIISELQPKITKLKNAGVPLVIDPGFGFSKTLEQNYELLRRLDEFNILGLPLLVGFSRKSMIYKTLNTTADEALNGTTVLNTVALQKGASILRVHDTKEAVECLVLTSV